MTIAAEVDGDFTPVGICYRYSIDDGDTLYAIFSDTDLPRPRGNEGYNVFSPGVAWLCEPNTGATSIEVETTPRPDFDKATSSHWYDHGIHGTVDTTTGYLEDAPLCAMRFTADGGGAVIHFISPLPILVE